MSTDPNDNPVRSAGSFLDEWLFENYRITERSLADYRIVCAALFVVFVAPKVGEEAWVGAVPDPLFEPPPGPMLLFSGLPPGWVMTALSIAILAAATAMFLGLRARIASLSTGVLLLLYNGFHYGTGMIFHGQHLVLTVFLFLGAFAWGRAEGLTGTETSEDGERRGYGSVMALLALFVGFAMMTAGALKLAGGWLIVDDHAVHNYLFKNLELYGRKGLLTEISRQFVPFAVWEAMDWTTVIFELGFLPAVLSRRWFRGFCAVGVIFHAGVLLLLTISFAYQIIAYAAFLDWDEFADRWPYIRRFREWLEGAGAEDDWTSWTVRAGLAAGGLLAVRTLVRYVLADIELGGNRLPNFLLAGTGVLVVTLTVAGKLRSD